MIDIEKKIGDLGLSLEKRKLEECHSGYIEYDGSVSEFKITINSNHGYTFNRFMMAKLLGYYVLHKQVIVENGRISEWILRGEEKETSLLDMSATNWALECLLPTIQFLFYAVDFRIINAFAHVRNQFKEKRQWDIDISLTKDQIKYLAKIYGVSEKVITLRIEGNV